MRSAEFSEDRVYRYSLTIIWDASRPLINFLMLNPSTADEVKNDPTVERCERRARMWGFGGVIITNIFAFRSTDPTALYLKLVTTRDTDSIVGLVNDSVIVNQAKRCEGTVCGWGQHGKLSGRSEAVKRLCLDFGILLYYLKMSKGGEPYHPLYVPYSELPKPWMI